MMSPKKFFFIVLGIISVLILLGGGGYYLAYTKIQSTSIDLSKQLANQVAVEDQLTTIRRLEYTYNRDVKPIIPLIDQALPRTKNQTEILSQLQRIANESGLELTGVSFPTASGLPSNLSQTVQSGSVLALPITFQLSGSYAELQSFLTRAENLSRFTNVTNLAVSRPDKTKPITYSMTLNAYIMP